MASKHIQDTRQLFVWLMGCVYMFAFSSLFVQIPGLYSANGLLPVYNVIPKEQGTPGFWAHVHSLFIRAEKMGLPLDVVMEMCCLVGALLAFAAMVFRAMRCSLVFLLMWALYLIMHKVGQTFLWFQWDTLLLETGILTVLVAPINLFFWKKPKAQAHDSASFWQIRWLLFRLMFASGVVKLTSNCPTWWGLTALNFHYESQCIPTPLAWYAHQLPEWFQKISVAGTYFIEIGVPFLFFAPVRSLRMFAFWCQVFFQVCIILTGNYNFFNLLTVVLCVSLLDDKSLQWIKRKKVPQDWSRRLANYLCSGCGHAIHILGRVVIFTGVVGCMVVATLFLFEVRVSTHRLEVLSRVVFTDEDLHRALSYAVPVAAGIATVCLGLELMSAIWESLTRGDAISRLWSLTQTAVMGFAICGLFSISMMSHAVLDNSFHARLSQFFHLHHELDEFSLSSPYGLFRRMTGVGGRPELIVEGSNHEDGPWKEYDFLYKPGALDEPLPFVAPHQPRLDWQMWFAALGNYQRNPWLVHLVYRLLQGKKEVLELMAPPPFDPPPKFIRVRHFLYHFTEYNYSKPFLDQTSDWWWREFQQDYLFVLSLDHMGLKDYLAETGVLAVPQTSCKVGYVCPGMAEIRALSRSLPPTQLLLAMFATALALTLSSAFVSRLFRTKNSKKVEEKQASVTGEDRYGKTKRTSKQQDPATGVDRSSSSESLKNSSDKADLPAVHSSPSAEKKRKHKKKKKHGE